MARKREFGEGPIFTITNYIFWFMGGSFYFGICNILFLFTLLVIASTPVENADPSFLTLLMISAIPAGPAITALLSSMGKLVREKDVNITRDFFKAYKQSFKQSFLVWIIELAAIGILLVDFIFFSRQPYGKYVIPFIAAIGIVVSAMGLYAFPIISRFHMKTKDVIRLSFYYTIVKYKITIMNIAALIIGGFVIYKFTLIGVIFAASGVAFLLMYYEKDLLKELEDQFSKDDDKSNEVNKDKIFSDRLNDN
jgi:uncharacterized membrane protein YesL